MKIKVDTTFLQTLIKGEKSLYYYKNAEKRENFYIKKGNDFELLYYKRYLANQDGKRIIADSKKYIGQLNLYLHDCATIYSKLEDVSYTRNSLKNLFQYYYECTPSNISFQKETEKIKPEFGILAGASLTSLEFKSREFAYLVNGEFTSSVNFSAGVFLDVILTRNQRKWSIYNEILFTTYKTRGYFERFDNENSYEKTTTEIGYSYLKMNNLIRYTYPIGNSFIFLNGGMSNGFAVSETNYKKKESRTNTIERVVEETALNSTRKHEQGLLLGTGIKYSKYSLELRYERGNGMSDFSALNSITKSYYILLGYRF